MTQLKEQHNREVQATIDRERVAIKSLEKEIEGKRSIYDKLQKELLEYKSDIRTREINIANRERKIEVETQRLWK